MRINAYRLTVIPNTSAIPMKNETIKSLQGLQRLRAIMSQLRDPEDGCPWDIEQDFATIAPYTIEEAYEVADAIERADMGDLKDELGDLLLQVVYHAQMAQESGEFELDDVIDAICDKMIRRHPHVFGNHVIDSAAAQTEAWEAQKAREREASAKSSAPVSVLDGVAKGYPALLRAEKLQKRAARVGFDWPTSAGALAKLKEEIGELEAEMSREERSAEIEDELADVLFSVVNLARKLDIDPESALRQGNAKFERRFRWIESRLGESGKDFETVDLEYMESLWQQAKALEIG
jgi:MazG family protein